MYERNAAFNGGYGGLANTWAGKPPKDMTAYLPPQRNSILTQDQAAKVIFPKVKVKTWSSMSQNVYWGAEGPLYTTRKMKGLEQATRMPAIIPNAVPAIKIVRDLPKAELAPLEGWTDIQSQQKLIVLSLLAVGVYLYCKSRWKTV